MSDVHIPGPGAAMALAAGASAYAASTTEGTVSQALIASALALAAFAFLIERLHCEGDRKADAKCDLAAVTWIATVILVAATLVAGFIVLRGAG